MVCSKLEFHGEIFSLATHTTIINSKREREKYCARTPEIHAPHTVHHMSQASMRRFSNTSSYQYQCGQSIEKTMNTTVYIHIIIPE